MSRYGGNASVGKADGYEQRQRPQVTPAMLGAGAAGGAAWFGHNQVNVSRRIPTMAAEGKAKVDARVNEQQAVVDAAKRRANKFTTQRHSRRMFSGGLFQNSRERRAKAHVDLAERELDARRALAREHANASAPEMMERRMHRTAKVGRTMRAGGLTTLAGIGAYKGAEKMGLLNKADVSMSVSKTISQSRYGGNAEVGRIPMEQRKKERNTAAGVAAGSGAVGVAGGSAWAAGNQMLKPRASNLSQLQSEHAAAQSEEAKARKYAAKREKRARSMSIMRQGVADISEQAKQAEAAGDTAGLNRARRRMIAERQLAGMDPAKYPIPKKGPSDPTHAWANEFQAKLVRREQKRNLKAANARAAARQASRAAGDAGSRVTAEQSAIASHKASQKGGRALVRGGRIAAGVGAAGALGAGAIAERNRGRKVTRSKRPDLVRPAPKEPSKAPDRALYRREQAAVDRGDWSEMEERAKRDMARSAARMPARLTTS